MTRLASALAPTLAALGLASPSLADEDLCVALRRAEETVGDAYVAVRGASEAATLPDLDLQGGRRGDVGPDLAAAANKVGEAQEAMRIAWDALGTILADRCEAMPTPDGEGTAP